MHFDLDVAIFLSYILIVVSLGLYWGRSVKNIKSYALGGRNFSTGTLIGTIMASWLGGDYLFITLEEVYTTGIHYALGCLGMAFGLFLIAHLFVPRMGEFLGNISVAEAMGNLYGKEARLISAITGAIVASGFVAVQFRVFGDLFSNYVGISDKYAIFIAGSLIVIYSAFGGIRSVIFTDVIQFFTFGVLIPVLSMILWNEYIGISGSSDIMKNTAPIFTPNEFSGFSNPKFWQLIFLFVLFAFPGFDPTLFQRISIGRNISQVQKAFNVSSIFLLFILCGMAWIAFLLYNINPNLDAGNLVHHIINNYSHTGLKGFILIGIVAMCMSNADSNINSASVVLTHDFLNVLNIGQKDELLTSRLVGLCLGSLALFLAQLNYDLLSLVFMTQSYYIPITAVPLMMAIFGFRSSKKSVLIGMAGGFTTVLIWRIFFMDATEVDSIVPGVFGNLVCLMGAHYLLKQKGGWVGIKDKSGLSQIQIMRQRKWSKFFNKIAEFSFLDFCRRNAPKNEMTYTGFGIFALISTMSTMYSTYGLEIIDRNTLLVIFESILILSVAFITYPVWPSALKEYRTTTIIVWNFSLFYILIVCSTFFAIITGFSPAQIMISMLNLIVVSTLIRWQAAFSFILVGTLITIQFCLLYLEGGLSNSMVKGVESKIMYVLLLLSSILIIFFKPKQDEHDLAEEKNTHLGRRIEGNELEMQNLINLKNEFLRNINHELHTPVTGITSMGQALLANYDKLSEKEKRETIEIIANSSDRFETYTNSILDLSKLSSMNFKLNYRRVDLSSLLFDRMESCTRIYSGGKPLDFKMDIDPNVIANCDKYYMQLVFENLIINAITYTESGEINVSLKIDGDNVEFSIRDEGIGVMKEEIFDIFEPFTIGTRTRTPSGGRGIGLAICKKSVEAHKGKIWAEPNHIKGVTFRFKIPK